MSEIEWTNDSVIRLVQEYKKRPMLWDVTHELYRVQNVKYGAYMELANVFDCDIVDLRKKLNSIFASHRREKAKVRSGSRSTWFLYPHMRFLPNHLDMNDADIVKTSKKRKARDASDEEDASSENGDDEKYDDSHEEELLIKREHTDTTPTLRTKKYARPLNSHKPRLTKTFKRPVPREVSTSQLDNRLIEALKLLRRSDLSRKKDECDSFGEYIAVSLRKHDERTQSMIKQAINNILFEQEMKKFSSTQYVVITGMDENPLTLGDNDSSEK